ncbi:MFS transporter [uncultured Bifidobacterium sp.]|uniref:MFS transporter n=1 Tax=uncultured Bifidobacterium sp. TaxID=165187 RepID=UPI0025D959B2|nr:MFS transporter [uncultured Bifidobacterium sp.]
MGAVPVKKPSLVLLAVAVSAFLATFNETFLNVALNPIMADFNISSAEVQWVSTVYMLVASITVPIASFLYRSIHTKRLTLAALVLLLAGSVIGAAAMNFPMLLVGRGVQALGTGLIVPIGMNLTLLVAPKGKLGTYMGVVSAVTLLGPAFGPIGGGLVLSAANWHILFACFAVLTLICLIINAVFIDDFAELSHPRLDILSIVLVCIGLVGILYGISTAFSGAGVIAAICGVVGIICMALFIMRQRKIDDPLLNLSPFSDTGFNVGLVVVFIAFMAVFAANMMLPLFMQGSLGFTALDAAMTLLPPCILCCIFAPIAGKLFDKFGLALTLPVALAVMAIFMTLLSRSTVDTPSIMLVLLYAPILIGCSFSVGPAQSFALSRLSSDMHPHGVTMCYMMIQVAGCVGSSVYVGVLSAGESAALAKGMSTELATASGFSLACTVAACLMVVGFLFALATAVISRRKPRAVLAALASDKHISVDEIMTKDVFFLPSSANAFEALTEMANRKTSGLPVVSESGAVVGFVSDGDVMRALSDDGTDTSGISRLYAHWSRSGGVKNGIEELQKVPVLDVATRKVVSVERSMGINDVCRVLSEVRLKKVPVIDNGRMVGIISRSDLFRRLIASEID